MPWVNRYYNPGTEIGSQLAGNVTVALVSGTIQFSHVSADSQWDGTNKGATIAYKDLSGLVPSGNGFFMLYAKGHFVSGNTIKPGVCLLIDKSNAIENAYDSANGYVGVREMTADVVATIGSGSSGNLTPVWYKIYWNRSGTSQQTKEGDPVPDNNYRAYWSPDNAVWYTITGTPKALPFVPTRIGWFHRGIFPTHSSVTQIDDIYLDELTGDEESPLVRMIRPKGSSVRLGDDIALEVVDAGSGVDDTTVEIWVNDVVAWTGDAQQTGFTVTKTAIAGGFRYDVNPDSDFNPASPIYVRVLADDLAASPNSIDKKFTFHTGAWV